MIGSKFVRPLDSSLEFMVFEIPHSWFQCLSISATQVGGLLAGCISVALHISTSTGGNERKRPVHDGLCSG